jgi:hypothetical protein
LKSILVLVSLEDFCFEFVLFAMNHFLFFWTGFPFTVWFESFVLFLQFAFFYDARICIDNQFCILLSSVWEGRPQTGVYKKKSYVN